MRPITVLASLLIAASTHATEDLSAGTLLSFCQSSDRHSNDICSIYILGVVQGLDLGSHFRACVPENVSEAELAEVYKRQASALKSAYPSDMKLAAVGVVAASIAKNFPCKRP
jgi:hypothetical protein